MNKSIQVSIKNSAYPVVIGQGLLSSAETWEQYGLPQQLLVVSDETVASHYLDTLRAGLSGHRISTHILPPGEQHKTIESWRAISDRLVSEGALRDSTVIALGGGIVGDLAGFAAATYMRGIAVVQVPTTLLAQVDASVGGKTGVNHSAGKNLIGAFHQPRAVIIDTETLDTLPPREFTAGLAEVVKYGVIRDPGFLEWIQSNTGAILDRNHDVLVEMISRCVQHKAEVVEQDERESGIRAMLNFGHTFAHAIETLTGYSRFLHGEAVAIGMVAAARLSELRGLCPSGACDRIAGLLGVLELHTNWPAEVAPLKAVECMSRDKKARQGGLNLVLLRALGATTLDSGSTGRDIVRAIESMTTQES